MLRQINCVQDKVNRGEFGIDKVDGKKNIADALTKPVGNEDLSMHITGVGIRLSTDRHSLAPKVGNWDGAEGSSEIQSLLAPPRDLMPLFM